MKIARFRKAIAATLGTAATIAATIPPETPLWRTAQVILGLATIAGVTAVRNAPPAEPPPAEGSAAAGNTVYKR